MIYKFSKETTLNEVIKKIGSGEILRILPHDLTGKDYNEIWVDDSQSTPCGGVKE